MTLFEFVLLVVVALVVWAIVSGKIDSKKLKDAIADLKDDGRLNGSNVQSITVTPEHLQAVAEIVRAAQPSPAPIAQPAPAAVPEYNGVGDPPSQEAWAKWRSSLNPMLRSFYPEVWRPTPTSAANPAMDVPAVFKDGVMIHTDGPYSGQPKPLTRGVRVKVLGQAGEVYSFRLLWDVTRVTIAETSDSGDQARRNLWGSTTPRGPAIVGDAAHEFQYNNATLIVPAGMEGAEYANVRQLVADGSFYIQAN